jgi:thiJ/pfpI domain protein
MYDFPENTDLQAIIAMHYEARKIVSAACHGVGGLLNVRVSNGKNLIADKKVTGFSWLEEFFAQRKKLVPFNLEQALKNCGAHYEKVFFLMDSKVVIDENLITGQNPFSSKAIARAVIAELKK